MNITINDRSKRLVSSDNFFIHESKINIIFGESGIGKSLLSKTLMGLLRDSNLDISINERSYDTYIEESETYSISKNGFYVFQEPSSYFNPLMTIREQIDEGDLEGIDDQRFFEMLWDDDSWRALLDIYPKDHRPSGGEKQRIYNLMALKKMSNDCKAFFVFDEPTGNLDEFNRDLFLNALIKMYEPSKHTIILITHDYSMIDFIINNHSRQSKNIEYKELVRENKNVSLNDFKVEQYILLHQQFPEELSKKISDDIVLRMEKDVVVYGKNLKFMQNDKDIEFLLSKGSISYLKARSGVGKTTIAKIIIGLVEAEQFKFNLHHESYDHNTPKSVWAKDLWSKKIGFVFQHADRALNSASTIWETFKYLPIESLSKDHVLKHLKLIFPNIKKDFLNKKISTLSGGQKQRINLLRAFILETDIIILDEPFTGLDLLTMKIVLDLVVKKLNKGVSFLLISHNETIFDKIIPQSNIWHLKNV